MKKTDNKFCRELSLENKFVVLYSGNQGRCHDLLTIVNCAYYLKNDYQTVFLFIGNGAQNNFLKQRVHELNLKNIIFKDYQAYEDLNYSLNSADLAIVSLGKNTEGLIAPSKLYGHLAAGSPIAAISPKDSYLTELINSYNFGEWINNDDYISLSNLIRKLKEDIELRNRYKNNARKLFEEHFSANLIVEKYDLILRDL